MTTALDVIKSAMRKCRVLRAGETPAPEDAEDCLYALNSMLDTWSAENLMIYALTVESKALTDALVSITIGTGGDISSSRPDYVDVKSSFIRDANDNDYPLVSIVEQEYNRISAKSLGNSIPQYLFYKPSYPLGTVYLWPPAMSGYTLYLASAKPFTAFADLATDLSFPPGYQETIEFNLAVRIAPDFGKVPAPDVVSAAVTLKSNIKSRSRASRPLIAEIDLPCGMNTPRGSILTGWQ